MRIPPYCKASKHKYKDSSRRQKLPQIIFGSWRNFYGVRMGHFWNGAISGAIWQQSIWKYPTKQIFIKKISDPKSFAIFGGEWIHLGCFAGWWQSINLTQAAFPASYRHPIQASQPLTASLCAKKTNIGYKFCILLGKQFDDTFKSTQWRKIKQILTGIPSRHLSHSQHPYLHRTVEKSHTSVTLG